jgi:hypothetical protein
MALTLEIAVKIRYDKAVSDPEGAAEALQRSLNFAIERGLFDLPRFDPIMVEEYDADVICTGNEPEDNQPEDNQPEDDEPED